ncbi:SREBP regulating gene protein [Condylostylus longicornis]|uniref:SREBP regulating gene protein n=1 Tax=Condylostylus longicornis TaxID=2530218 RepID=UPI00244DB9DF|nr:SREBP regulating gene protein [Condylostylus longicornis]
MLGAVIRFIRRRIVLGIIFFLSLTYFLVSLFGRGSQLLDSDEFEIKRQHPLIWRSLQEDSSNRTNDLSISCRNSVQGKVLIVDDRGFVCQRSDLLWTGCCNIETPNTKQYLCETCNPQTNCCAIYEYCVSCCSNPNKRELLERVISKSKGRQSAVFASVRDHFELCLVKCRTNSHSVQHENKYRDPKTKHCYGETEAHESQKEVAGNSVL